VYYNISGVRVLKIYLDILIIGNFLITELCLRIVYKLSRTVFSKKRLILGGTVNAVCSVLIVIIPKRTLERLLIFTLRIAVSLLVIFIATGHKRFSKLIKCFFIYLVSDFMLCGAFVALWEITNNKSIFIRNGIVYLNIPIWLMLICTCIAYGILMIYDSITTMGFAKQKNYRAELIIGDMFFSLPAFCDSGNLMKDCFSGKSVVVFTSNKIFYGLGLDNESSYPSKGIHLVPYATVNGDALMPVTQSAKVNVISSDGVKTQVCCAVGFTKSHGEERALFDPRLII